jgi:hypothetical protein
MAANYHPRRKTTTRRDSQFAKGWRGVQSSPVAMEPIICVAAARSGNVHTFGLDGIYKKDGERRRRFFFEHLFLPINAARLMRLLLCVSLHHDDAGRLLDPIPIRSVTLPCCFSDIKVRYWKQTCFLTEREFVSNYTGTWNILAQQYEGVLRM